MAVSYQLIHHQLKSNSIKVIDIVYDLKHIPSMLIPILKEHGAKYVLSQSKLPQQLGKFLVKQDETHGALHRYLLGNMVNVGYIYDTYAFLPEEEFMVSIYNDTDHKTTEDFSTAIDDLSALTHRVL